MNKAPSAELIPARNDQDDLPPYEIMNPIIRYWQEDKLSVAEIIARGYDPVTVRDIIGRCEQNEFKRRQLPPGLRITSPAWKRETARP